jgi:peptidoglycan hydrolase-like protein with peptidoglycan-binding domain
MSTLKQGSTGPEVTILQTRLKELGFDPGAIDGQFGQATAAALTAFQQSRGLQVDGKAGPQTMSALQINAAGTAGAGSSTGTVSSSGSGAASTATGAAPTLAGVTVEIVAKMFPGTPLANIQTNLPFVLQALADADLADTNMVLMALATIRAETGNFTPLSEFKSRFNTAPGGAPFALYDNRRDLGNQGPPDGENFKGRGYIQLTGRANYQVHGAAVGLGSQLINNPSLANQPDVAAKLLASFLKSKEQGIRNALSAGNLTQARKLVNGGSHGLEEFTAAFKIGQKLLGTSTAAGAS